MFTILPNSLCSFFCFKLDMNLSHLSIAVFGDSHVTKLIIPPNIVIFGRGGEKLANWKSYESELVGYDVLVIMIGGNDISSKDPLVTAPSDLKGLMKTMGEVVSFVEAKNGLCLIADIIPRLSNGQGIHYANSRLAKKYKQRHIQLAGIIKQDDLCDGVHLKCYRNLSKLLLKKISTLSSKKF